MKMYIQYATDPPQGYEEYDSSDWGTLPKGPEPTGSEVITSERQWVHTINIQGIVFDSFDHYVVYDQGQVTYVAVWNDDVEDHGEDINGRIWALRDPAPDPNLGGKINTRQQCIMFTDYLERINKFGNGKVQNLEVQPYSRMRRFNNVNIAHGIWVPDTLNDQLLALRTEHNWREWIV